MSRKNDSAFPQPPDDVLADGRAGLTIREWMAGQALTGLLANPSYADDSYEHTAHAAVFQADALLAELEKGSESVS